MNLLQPDFSRLREHSLGLGASGDRGHGVTHRTPSSYRLFRSRGSSTAYKTSTIKLTSTKSVAVTRVTP